jgi:formate dehydrogenase iron-sulfur subunit
MATIYYVPRETTACALGADRVASVLEAHLPTGDVLVRNGSRGLCWLEPLLEVAAGEQRIAFGPLPFDAAPDAVPAIIEAVQAGRPESHDSYLGPVEDIPYLAQQQRLTFARIGKGDPLCLDNYRELGGWQALHRALTMTAQQVVDEVKNSGLRGRGGAAFPAGIKWQTVLDASGPQKTIVCNADEGDSGSFADRLLMECDPYQVIESMIIAGLAVEADQGYIYLRSEYPMAQDFLQRAIDTAYRVGYLGDTIAGSERAFNLEVRLGAEAYICGEETALLDSLEGKRGMVRFKPPLPALEGLFGCPTVVNNVLTLAAVTTVLAEGSDYYRDFGSGRSRGTLALQLAGNIRRGGLVELAFGTSLRTLVEDFGGGSYSGRALRAIQAGGPLGAYLAESQWDIALDYEAFAQQGAMLGHGGLVVFDDTVDMAAQARFAMEFCALESCGKCTPCRVGAVRGVEVIDRLLGASKDLGESKDLVVSSARQDAHALLLDLCETMELGSMCAMGGLTPMPVRSALTHFPEDFGLATEG